MNKKKIALEMLLKDIAYEPARVRGKDRIAKAVENGEIYSEPVLSETEQLSEILSYPISRMIASCAADKFLISRYALGEAVLLEKRLSEEEDETTVVIARELDIEPERSGRGFRIHFTDFLKTTSSIRAKEWKLVNQEIFSGMVEISRARFARIVRQRLYDKIILELPLEVTEEIIDVFGADAKKYSRMLESTRKKFSAGELGPIDDVSFPPCMKTILTMIRNGENVPHTARFAITSFLHAVGMNSDMIIKSFSASPDFDASKSEYQVRHIVGEISGTEYTPPECSTMKSNGICYNPDDLCGKDWMTHSLKYYRNKKKWRSSGKGAPHTGKPLEDREVRSQDEDDKQKVEKSE